MAISLEQLQSQIAASELLKKEEVSAFISAFPEDKRPKSAEELARELVRQKRLTKYQAEQIYAGKGKMLVLGNYVVLDKLGQGGMGVVLRAEHKRLKRPVALKVMSPTVVKTADALKRFHREVEAAAKLRHPNVVATDDADEAKGTHFLVMEYVEGSDLSAIVKKNGPLPVDQAVQCILQAARGLEFAHSQGVVHRDIKPANLLLDKSGVVKILDMGLARIEGDAGSQGELTSTGAVMGTVDYMAPEQALSTKDADARSDIYSLGISLWYLLTGRCAFEGDSLMAKLLAHRDAAIPSLRKANTDVPEVIEAVFRKMVAKQRTDRYQSMTDVVRDLESYTHGTNVSPVNVSMPDIPEDLNLQSFLSQIAATGGPSATSVQQRTVPGHIQVAPASEATALMGGISVDTDPQATATIQSQARRNTPSKKQSKISTAAPPPWFRNVRILSAAGGAALIMLFAAVFFLRTPHGTLRVEILDPEVELKIEGTELTFRDGRNEPVSLTTGEKRLIVSRGNLSFETETFTLKKGQEILVRVELIEDKLVASSNEQVIGEKSIGRSLVTASTTGQKTANAAIVKPQPKTESATTTPIPETGLRFSPGDVVELPMASSPDKAECTLEMWLTPASDIEPTGYSSLFDVSRGGLIIENYRFRFYTFHGHAQSEPTLQPGQRIHVAGVNNGKRRLLYLNGQLIATSPDAGHPNPDTAPSPQRIGGSSFRGLMHAVRISSVARYSGPFKPPASFEPDQKTVVLYRFDEGSGDVLKDSSGNGQHGKILGAEWVSDKGVRPLEPRTTGQVIDLQAMVKLPDHATDDNFFSPNWSRNGSTLLSPSGGKPGIICLDDELPAEYEINSIVERVDGQDGVCFGLTVDGHRTSVCIDMYGGPLSGLTQLDGKHANENETTLREKVLNDSEQNTIRIRVQGRRIQAHVNDRRIIDWEGDPQRLSVAQTLPRPGSFWFGAGYGQFKFHKLELTPLVPSIAKTETASGPAESASNVRWPFDPDDGQEYEWSEPENLGAAVNDNRRQLSPSLTDDECTLLFYSTDRLMIATRASRNESFSNVQPLPDSINGLSTLRESCSLSGDGLQLVFVVRGTNDDIWLSQRTTIDEPFGTPVRMEAPVNTDAMESAATLSADGLTLCVTSTRQGKLAGSDCYMFIRSSLSAPFGNPFNAGREVNTAGMIIPNWISNDRKLLLITTMTTRPFRSTWHRRASEGEPFGAPFPLGPPFVRSEAGNARLSADGQRLYFHSREIPRGHGDLDLWVVHRVRK